MHYTFADCMLDTQRYVLHRAGILHHLRPKVFQVLQYLVQHRERVVAKQELAEQLWPAQYISDGVVENTIMAVRRVVGDSGRTQGIIQTLPGHGYRFVAVVRQDQPSAEGDVRHAEAGRPDAGAVTRESSGMGYPLPPPTLLPEAEADAGLRTQSSPHPACAASSGVEAHLGRAGGSMSNIDGVVSHTSRRQLTILCYDLINDPALTGQLALDDLHEVLSAYHTTCAEVIHRFEGTIAQTSGTGRVVYFGYPYAHEDDAVRAVQTALSLVKALSALAIGQVQGQDTSMTVRLGIHTGLAVISTQEMSPAMAPLALGAAPAFARQIQMLAPPQTIVISGATARLVEGLFLCRPIAPLLPQGMTLPEPLMEVLQASEVQHRFEVTRRHGLGSMVGRDDELDLLVRRWKQGQQGCGQGILVWGEAGIGKSRLVEALRACVGSQAHTERFLRCAPCTQQSAWYPVVTQLQQHLPCPPHTTPAVRLSTLEQRLLQGGFPAQDLLAPLATLLDIPLPAGVAPVSVSPERCKQQMQEALTSWLLGAASQQPTLLVWEDMHWADPSSLELLRLLIDQLPLVPVLVLVTCRPFGRPLWPVRSYLTELTLNRLPACEVQRMVALAMAGKAVPPMVLQEVLTKSDGVPLFVEELLKMLVVSGGVEEDAVRQGMADPSVSLTIPHTLQGLLQARLDLLDVGREVAQLAAVLGREFRYDVLQAMAPIGATRLQQGLTQLVEAELLYQRGQPPQASYCFKHALIQEVAYQSLMKRTRQQQHHRLARVLEAQDINTAEAPPELLAYHYTEAGCAEPAIDYWQQAGRQASTRSAYVEAVHHLRRGLDLLETLPETPQRRQHALTFRILLGPALMALQGYGAPEVERVYAQARQLCLQLDDQPQHFLALWGLYSFYIVRGQCHTAYELAQQCLRMAQRANDPLLLLRAHVGMGESLYWLGEVSAAYPHLAQSLALYEAQQQQAVSSCYGQDPAVLASTYTALVLWQRGCPEQALQTCQHALRRAQELAHPPSVVWACFFLAIIHSLGREFLAVQTQVDTVLTLATAHAFPFWQAGGTILRGWSLAMQGQTMEGLALMQQGLEAHHSTGAVLGRPYFLALLAEASGASGQYTAGLAVLAEALDVADKSGERGFIPELYRLQGELLLGQSGGASGDEAAEACYLRALHLACQAGASMWQLRTAICLCRLWQRRGQLHRGQRVLAAVYVTLTEGFATVDLHEAQALLAGVAPAGHPQASVHQYRRCTGDPPKHSVLLPDYALEGTLIA